MALARACVGHSGYIAPPLLMLRSDYDSAAPGRRAALGTPPRRDRRRTALLVVSLLALLAAPLDGGPLDAAPAQVDERARRDQVRDQKAAAAAELDALQASDAELEAAVATLQANVAAQEARVSDARREVDAAEAEAARLEDELARTEADVERLRFFNDTATTEIYTGFGTSELSALHEGDPTDSERRKALLEAVNGNEADVVDQLRGAQARLDRQRQEVADSLEEARRRRAEADQRLAELDQARSAEQSKLAALQVRVQEYRSEVDALAAQEDELTAIIAAADAQRAAEAAAADQRAAEQAAARRAAERAASPSSSSAPSSTAGASSSSSSSSGATTPAPAPSGGGLVWPCNGTVTSGFGQRWGRLHAGLDISAPTGTPIMAAASGTVIFAGVQSGYGNIVLVDHGNGLVTAYAHQSRIATSNGAAVSAGQVIGYVGSTGRSTGPHLHFETRVNGSARDPMGYF